MSPAPQSAQSFAETQEFQPIAWYDVDYGPAVIDAPAEEDDVVYSFHDIEPDFEDGVAIDWDLAFTDFAPIWFDIVEIYDTPFMADEGMDLELVPGDEGDEGEWAADGGDMAYVDGEVASDFDFDWEADWAAAWEGDWEADLSSDIAEWSPEDEVLSGDDGEDYGGGDDVIVDDAEGEAEGDGEGNLAYELYIGLDEVLVSGLYDDVVEILSMRPLDRPGMWSERGEAAESHRFSCAHHLAAELDLSWLDGVAAGPVDDSGNVPFATVHTPAQQDEMFA